MRPSLALIPCAHEPGKLYSLIPEDGTGDFTVSRNGAATRVNKDGLIESVPANVPRFNYDPITGEFLGVLVEPAATNEIRNSMGQRVPFGGSIIFNANTEFGPDGNLSAYTIIRPESDGSRLIWQTGAPASSLQGRITTFSCWLRADSEVLAQINIGDRAASIVNVTTEWKRFTTSYNGELAGFHSGGGIAPLTSNVNYYAFGLQLETGPVATSYIPTTTSQVTRPAEIISRTGIAHLIGQTEGSVYCEFYNTKVQTAIRAFILINPSLSGRFSCVIINSNIIVEYYNPSYVTGASDTVSVILGLNKVAFTYAINGNIRLSINGRSVKISPGNINVPSEGGFNSIILGTTSLSGGSMLNDNFKKALFFKEILSDSQLQELTTL